MATPQWSRALFELYVGLRDLAGRDYNLVYRGWAMRLELVGTAVVAPRKQVVVGSDDEHYGGILRPLPAADACAGAEQGRAEVPE